MSEKTRGNHTRQRRRLLLRVGDILQEMVRDGHRPGVYYRGRHNGKPVWRVHVDVCKNWWDEGRTPDIAARKAWRLFKSIGPGSQEP